jgi:hypothetical protein
MNPIPAVSQCVDTQHNQSTPDNSKSNPALKGHFLPHHYGAKQELQNRG